MEKSSTTDDDVINITSDEGNQGPYIASTNESVNSTSKSQKPLPQKFNRILDRDGAFEQSMGRWNIKRIRSRKQFFLLYLFDPFHTIVHVNTLTVWLLLALTYVAVILIYAALYLAVDESCLLQTSNFIQAVYFSTETLITIGYGAQGGDIFFNDCTSPLVLIITQSLVGVLLDALAIGIVFQRFARGQSRANTVIFSNKAVLRRIRGHLYLKFQVCEMRKHQLTEAHVRCYAIRNDLVDDSYTCFQSYVMRLQHPDDELGGMLLMALPSVVVHRLDAWSPLIPKKTLPECAVMHEPSVDYLFPEPLQRAADAEAGSRECNTEQKSSTISRRRNSRRSRCLSTKRPVYSCSEACEEHSVDTVEALEQHEMQLQALREYWESTNMEIVVLVEGVDAATSYSIQARHSYTSADIIADHTFVNCVYRDNDTGNAVIDFNKFHDVKRSDDFSCMDVRGSFY